jgi:diguanylate cyclase
MRAFGQQHDHPTTAPELALVDGALTTLHDPARLDALYELGLLDSPPSETFDRFTRLATDLLGVPVSLVSLVDADRQFFLSQQGLPGELAVSRETPLTHSLCKYAVASGRPLVIEDARRDPTLANNPAVTALGVVAYAGMPLVLEDGSAIGAICALDRRPRRWTELELRVLSDLGAAVQEILDLRVALANESHCDRLTGLPNRTLLVATCDRLLRQTRDHDGLVAVMCAGLDDFTQINQALGTDAADGVLQAVSQRLKQSVRTTDVLGRLRGDIFTILVPNVPDEQEALGLAGRMRAALAVRPLRIGSEELSVTCTVGISTGRDGARGADMISQAASAMREAKRHHARVQVAEEHWVESATARLQLWEALRGALGRGEFWVAFQPVVELESGCTSGFEALARWQHPLLGHVSPADFIPAAEATAQILPIGNWVLDQALGQLAAWRQQGAASLYVTVNVAPAQLEQPNFAEEVESILAAHGLRGDALVLEITEGTLLGSGPILESNLASLRELGVRIALDDFGTGYSALGYLKRFPIDVIKIDRSFVEDIEGDRHNTALVQAIVAMGRGMGTHIVAEGIESTGQLDVLRRLGCRYGQGFLFSRPLPAAESSPSATYYGA